MSRITVLFDVDETLEDTQYRLNVSDDELRRAVRVAQESGVAVGLNSDSPLETLLTKQAAWGMTGPTIAERGAVLSVRRPERKIISATSDNAAEFPIVRAELVDRLLERVTCSVLVGDHAALREQVIHDRRCDRVIIVSALRLRSLMFYALRRNERGGMECDPDLLDFGVKELRDVIFSNHLELWQLRDEPIDVNPVYGLCIFHLKETRKVRAARLLLRRKDGERLIMIGNSMSDFLDDPRVTHGAVLNAQQEFKIRAGGNVASKPLTAGAIELLDRLTR